MTTPPRSAARGRRPRRRTHPHSRARAGMALAEALVAALVLVVGVLATAGSVAGSARDARRARAVDAAGEVVAARVARWRAAPCVAGAGARVVGGPVGEEWWSVRVGGGVGVLTDTARAGVGPRAERVGVVAVARCAP